MRRSTKFALGLLAVLAAVWYVKRSGSGELGGEDVSPIDKPVPGEESIDERDVPTDHQE